MLPPGGEGQIKVTLTPKGRHTKISKKIMVVTNDPEQHKFPLTMTGSLLVDVVAEPAKITMRDLKVGARGTGVFSVQLSENGKAEITSVKLRDEENFSLEQIETEPNALATYEVTFKGRKDVGRTVTDVVVTTTGVNTPELKVPVRANTSLNLRYVKRQRFTSKGGKLPPRTLRISARHDDRAPKIKKVVDPDGLLETEVLPPQGPMASIRMTVREDAVPPDDEGKPHTLVLHTNDRDEPKIEIEYVIVPKGPADRPQPATPPALKAVPG